MGLLSNAFNDIKVKDEKEATIIKPIMVDVNEPVDIKTRQDEIIQEEPTIYEEPDDITVTLFEFKKKCVVKMSQNHTKSTIIIEYTPQIDDMVISFQRIYDDIPSSKVTEYKFSNSRLPIKYTLCENGYNVRINVVLLTYGRNEVESLRCLEAYEILLP
jgi:hypothetical protein